MTRNRLIERTASLAALAITTLPAMAQDELRPPKFNETPNAPTIMMFVVAVALVAAVIFAASLKPKRGHQD